MEPVPFRRLINQKEVLMFHGSCFSDHIADRLKDSYFHVISQPNGVLFNPVSLAEVFLRIDKGSDYDQDDLIKAGHYYHSKFHHGSFSELNASDALKKMNHALHGFKKGLLEAKHLFITFGSAFAYVYKASGDLVANCHKIPASEFEKRLLTVEEIAELWIPLLQSVLKNNTELQIVFTVSPVKHLKDGVVENNISKATCLLAIRLIMQKLSEVQYFPAYELVNDDLRDYRFYETDGAHPNTLAVDYVFEHFKKSFLSEKTAVFMRDIEQYNSMKNHRLIKADGEDYLRFMKKLEEKTQYLREKYELNI